MPQTLFIDTNQLPKLRMAGGGEMTDILNEALAGAKNVVGTLRWLGHGEQFAVAPGQRHQLVYLMDGSGTITLEGRSHDVTSGMGVYLGPSEGATIAAKDALKLFHLVVPITPRS